MKKTEPNAITLEAVHTHTHTGSPRGYLEYNKISIKNIKTRGFYMYFWYLTKSM